MLEPVDDGGTAVALEVRRSSARPSSSPTCRRRSKPDLIGAFVAECTAQIALAWLLAQKPWTVPLHGARQHARYREPGTASGRWECACGHGGLDLGGISLVVPTSVCSRRACDHSPLETRNTASTSARSATTVEAPASKEDCTNAVTMQRTDGTARATRIRAALVTARD